VEEKFQTGYFVLSINPGLINEFAFAYSILRNLEVNQMAFDKTKRATAGQREAKSKILKSIFQSTR